MFLSLGCVESGYDTECRGALLFGEECWTLPHTGKQRCVGLAFGVLEPRKCVSTSQGEEKMAWLEGRAIGDSAPSPAAWALAIASLPASTS